MVFWERAVLEKLEGGKLRLSRESGLLQDGHARFEQTRAVEAAEKRKQLNSE